MIEFDFYTSDEYTKEDIKKVQLRLLDMAKTVHEILTKNKVDYFITFGTLLGAVRHRGFIPWDDDFDIFIFDDQYDFALELFKKYLPRNYIVHDESNDPIYWPSWSRIRDLGSITNSSIYEDDNHYKYNGINLDLYRIKKIKKKYLKNFILKEHIRFYNKKIKHQLLSKKFKIKVLKLQIKLFFAKVALIVNGDKKEAFTFVNFLHNVPEDKIFPLKLYEFEGMMFYGPKDYDYILNLVHPNYMELPPIEKRRPHYRKVDFLD